MSESASEASAPAAGPALASQRVVAGGVHATMFALALPALLEQLLTFFVGFYDTWLSGEISAAATDAVGLATYVDWLGGMLFRLVGIGAAAIVARHWGAEEFEDANRTTNRALALASVMGLAVSAFLYAAAPMFTMLLGMQGESREIAIHYLRVDSICYFFLSFTFVGGAILRASGDMRTPMFIYALVGIVNVIAATAYVYGVGPIPKFGVNGIVMGTVTARIFGGVLIVAGFARGFGPLRLELREWRLRGEMVSRIMRTGIPAAADGALTWAGIFLFLMVVARGTGGVADDISLAAHFVGIRVEALTYLPADAWGFAAAAMVGQALGAGDKRRAKRAGHAGALQCSLLAGAMTIVFYLAAEPIYHFMHKDPQVVEIGIPAFKLLALFQIPLVVGTVYVHALRGAGDTRFPLWINLVGIFVVRLPLAYLCGVLLHGGLFGAWVGMCSDLGIRAIMATAWYIRGRCMAVEV
ncbi:MAG TPA: MATE family efflux transporter [Planctomycetaceae bacterium]|nr:MATE family efflux transporter [Planctomycetaceae bacterium]